MLTLLIALNVIAAALLAAAFLSRACAPAPTAAPTPSLWRDGDVLTRRLSVVDTIAGTDYSPAELRDRATLHRRIVQGGQAITPEALRGCRKHLEYAELLDDMAARREIEDRVHVIHEQGLREGGQAEPGLHRAVKHIQVAA
ncbi:hypothetical protein [Deinococcus sp. PEB2-63]